MRNHSTLGASGLSRRVKGSLIVLCLTTLLIGGFFGYVFAPMASQTIVEEGSGAETASYVIFLDGSTYYAKNGTTGAIDYSSASLLTVTQNANDALTNGGTILLKELRKPYGLTLSATVRLIEYYRGQHREYTWAGLQLGPLGTRVDKFGLAYYEGHFGQYVVRYGDNALNDSYYSLWTIGQAFDLGVYQWNACIGGVALYQNHIFGFEYHHGFAEEGLVAFECFGNTTGNEMYKTKTTWNTNTETTELTGQNWTTEHVFRVDWSLTQVKFYVNSTLVATHSSYIPQEPMCFFIEPYTGVTAPGDGSREWVRHFEEIP